MAATCLKSVPWTSLFLVPRHMTFVQCRVSHHAYTVTIAQCTRKLEQYGRERLPRGGHFRDNDPVVDTATGYQTGNNHYTIV
jgi:hypothetical protein